jgi:hypothetical protein
MRINPRRALLYLVVAGVAGLVLGPPAIYYLGLTLAPPPPVAAAAHVPPLLGDALWARAGGGRATAMRPLNPFNLAQMVLCMGYADMPDDPDEKAARRTGCNEVLPAMFGAEYVSRTHLRDQGFPFGPKYPFGQVATMTWITRSWTRPELIDTIAERGRFGFGIRGADVAARYYFGQALTDLSLPQAALLAAFVGEKDVNPWGEPELAAEMRNRILTRMRDDQTIDAATYENAMRSPLALAPEQPPQLPGS